MSHPRRTRSSIVSILVLALLAAGCLEEGGGGGGGDGADGDLSGMTVSVMGAFVEPAATAFREAVSTFEEETGATVEYESSSDFETLITTRVQGGAPPDIAMFPQPGLMNDLAEQGALRPLDDIVEVDRLREELIPGIYDLGTVGDEYYGLPRVIALKSAVWYPRPAWEEAGYEIPETWDELLELTQQIADDTEGPAAPWCIGVESGGATGWVITDWIEDLLLRTAGPEAYDDWIAGDLPFDSPEVTRAAEMFAEIAFDDEYLFGGRQSMLNIPFGEGPAPMFNDPPNCYLHRQASFITGFFPEDVTLGEDVDVFYLPPVTDGGFDGNPVLGSGDLASLLTENPAAEELMRYMSTVEFGEPMLDTGFDFSPFRGYPLEQYPTEVTQRQATILTEAEVFRFDASDTMPGVVGTGSFWGEMVRWVSGEVELQEALRNIDATWPDD
jgi:alpha-glucoside transport system substrate-binding protein